MSFRGLLRPGQGFKRFTVMRRSTGLSATGRPITTEPQRHGEFFGMISQATPREIEQWNQVGTPITHTIVQRGTTCRAKSGDELELEAAGGKRRFRVQGEPQDPGELGNFLIYKVEERRDLQ